MDEPLSNLDAKLRVQMRAEIAALQARLGIDDGVRHARPVGGDDARRSRRRARRRAAAAVRHAARALRAPGEHVRRRVHRLAVDEPLRRSRATNGSVELGGVVVPGPGAAAAPSEVVVGLRPESLELASRRDPGRGRGRRGARRRRVRLRGGGVSARTRRARRDRSAPERGERIRCGRWRARRTSSIPRPASRLGLTADGTLPGATPYGCDFWIAALRSAASTSMLIVTLISGASGGSRARS